jgi:hypothetical protein
MGILEIERAKRELCKKLYAQDPRILRIKEKAAELLNIPLDVSIDKVHINNRGFYNREKALLDKVSENNIRIPEKALDLDDDALFALVLTEAVHATRLSWKKSHLAISLFLAFLWMAFILAKARNRRIPAASAESNEDDASYGEMLQAYESDKLTVEKTGNLYALTDALNFIRLKETNETALRALEKRVKKLDENLSFEVFRHAV